MIGHKFQIGTAASKAKWKNPAKDVDYNFAPKLDGDVISTQKNLADSEDKLGHRWEIWSPEENKNFLKMNYTQQLVINFEELN